MVTLYNMRMPEKTPPAIRVAHSILDANALARHCASLYGLDEATRGQLLSHGQNDWYRLDTQRRPLALRVLKSGARTAAQLLAEVSWQSELASDLPVAAPLRTVAGLLTFEIVAPEGPRSACVYEWLEGRTLMADLAATDARDAGVQLGKLHAHPAKLALGARQHDLRDKLARSAAILDAALSTEGERGAVAAARECAAEALADVDRLPQGSLHGDVHFGNLRRAADGRLYLLDFDDCGQGALAADLTAFVWRRRCEKLAPELDVAFIEGYASQRPLTAAESRALPALHVARALYLAGVLARDRNLLGQVPGFDRPWAHYIALIEHATAAARHNVD